MFIKTIPTPQVSPPAAIALFDLAAGSGQWQYLNYREILEHFTRSLGVNIKDYLAAPDHKLDATSAMMLLFLRRRYQDSMGTMITYANNLCQFFNQARLPFHIISRYDVENYLLQLKERGLKTATINTKLSSLKSFYAFAVGEEAIQRDPTTAFEMRKAKALSGHHTKVLSLEDIHELVEWVKRHGSARNYVMLATMFFSGIRAIEVTRLCWGDLSKSITGQGHKGWYARVLGKGSDERSVYIPPWLMDRLMKYRWLEYRVQPMAPAPTLAQLPIFPKMSNSACPLSTKAIYKIVKEAGRAALGREISPHWTRHSFATNARLSGAKFDDIQAQMGHELMATTQRYEHSHHLRQSAAGAVFDDAPDGKVRPGQKSRCRVC